MKKIILVVTLFCSVSIHAQECGNANDILMEAKKDYLYHLVQLNTTKYRHHDGDERPINFRLFETYHNYEKLMFETALAFEKMKLNLQIKQINRLEFYIQVKDYFLGGIYVKVYFTLLENTNGFTKKSGEGEIAQKGEPFNYRWVLKDNLFIFIKTNLSLDDKLQQYVYYPK